MVKGVFVPETLAQAWRLANMYSKSGLVPKLYINNPQAVIIAGQYGALVGLDVLPSLQGIAVINGMPTIWGDTMLAVVRESGSRLKLAENLRMWYNFPA